MGRARGWQALLFGALTAAVTTTGGAAWAAPVPAPITEPTVAQLDAAFKVHEHALRQRQELEVARARDHWTAKAAEPQAARDAAHALIAAGRARALGPVDAQRAQLDVDHAHALTVAGQQTEDKRQGLRALFDGLARTVRPSTSPLPPAEADAAKKALEARLAAELAVLKSRFEADEANLRAELDRVKVRNQSDRQQLAATLGLDVSRLQTDHDGLVATAKAELEQTLTDLAAQREGVEARCKAAVGATRQQSAAEHAAVRSAGAPSATLRTLARVASSRLSTLASLCLQQIRALDVRSAEAKAGADTVISQAKAAYEQNLKALKATNDLRLTRFDRGAEAAILAAEQAIEARKTRYDDDVADAKALAPVHVAATLRSPRDLESAGRALLEHADRQAADTTRRAQDRLERQRQQALRVLEAEAAVVTGPFTLEATLADERAAFDRKQLEEDAKTALDALRQRHELESMLLSSDYRLMRTRAAAYGGDDDDFVAIARGYDPQTDEGSLYNVALNIGIRDDSPTGAGIRVALIDTGVVDVDGLAQADITIGPDFSFEDMDPETRGRDTNGHGTHLAGIIAARDDAWVAGDRTRTPARVLGIAPDARLVSIKAGAADGSADPSQVIAAINWVIRHNAENPGDPIRVINLAYGTDSTQDYTLDPLSYAVERAWKSGVVVVVAAGNDGWDTEHLSNPAINPFVIAVGAAQGRGDDAIPAEYSSAGSATRGVDLVAPGRSVVSLRVPGGWTDQFNTAGRTGDRLVRGSGTSQATAVVTGAVAVLLADRPWMTPDQVKATLMGTAEELDDATTPRLSGTGLLALDRALDSETLDIRQRHEPSTGRGSLEAARGTGHLVRADGTLLTGEQDVFGNDFGADGWATDAWAGSRWRAGQWATGAWAGSRWRDASWSSDLWAGSRWRNDQWAGSRWRDGSWTGSRWRQDQWAGSRWRGFATL